MLLRDAHRRLCNNRDYLNKQYNDQQNRKRHLKRKSRFYLFSIHIFKHWRWLHKNLRIPFVNDDIFRVASRILSSYCLLKFRKRIYQPDKSNFLVYHSKLKVINLSKKQSKQLLICLFSVLIGLSVYQHILSSEGFSMSLSYVIWSKYILKFKGSYFEMVIIRWNSLIWNKSHAITSSHQKCPEILVRQVPVYLSWLTIMYKVLILLFKIMFAFQKLKALNF